MRERLRRSRNCWQHETLAPVKENNLFPIVSLSRPIGPVKEERRLRDFVGTCHGLDRYKDLWASEVVPDRAVGRLPNVISQWSIFKEHFKLRHMLIHGRESCSLRYAEPRLNQPTEVLTQPKTLGTVY